MLEQESNVNQNFKQEAFKYAQLRQHFLNKANQSICTKIHPAVTAHYLDKVYNTFLIGFLYLENK